MVNGRPRHGDIDIIKHYGGEPANFLVGDSGRRLPGIQHHARGGQARAFSSIFGGISSSDNIANGIIEAAESHLERTEILPVPVVVRLEGTKVEEDADLKNTDRQRIPTHDGGRREP